MDALQIMLPTPVEKILRSLNDAGFSAYAVGGCVRASERLPGKAKSKPSRMAAVSTCA